MDQLLMLIHQFLEYTPDYNLTDSIVIKWDVKTINSIHTEECYIQIHI